MHKKILSMILAIAMVVSMFAGITVTASAAESVTLVFEGGSGTNQALWSFADEASGITAEIAIGTHTTNPRLDESLIRIYGTTDMSNVLTVYGPVGCIISGITFTMGTSYNDLSKVTADSGEIDTTTLAWSGSASSVSFTTTAQWRINSITVTYEASTCEHAEYTSETTAATCTEAGVTVNTCSACGVTWEEAIAALGHSIEEWTVTTEAACTTTGEKTGVCTVCGESVTETVAALGHSYGEAVVTAPTCTEKGYSTYTCTVCAYEKTGDATAALGHSYGEDGICTTCGKVKPETKNYEVITADTAAAGNYIIASTRNTTSAYPTVYPATITITSGHWCVSETAVTADSDILINDNLPVDAVIFTFEGDNTDGFKISYTAEDGTVMYLGYTSYAKATIAFAAEYDTFLWNIVANDDGELALQNTSDSGVYSITASTSTAVTSIRGYSSSTIYNSLYLFKEVAESEEGGETTCAHANTTTTAAVDATCTTAGMTEIVTCADCGEVITAGEEIAALGHTYAEGVCTVCGAAEPTYYDLATALNEYDNVVIYYPTSALALSATASGSKLAGVAATVADGKIALSDDMAVMTVNYVEGSETDFYLICNNMYLTSGSTGNSLTFAAEATDYAIWYLEIADEANGIVYIHSRNALYGTKTQSLDYYNGFTTYSTGTSTAYQFQLYTVAGEAPACEHSWDDGVVTTAATCTTEGVETFTCTLCGETKTGTIAATGHTYIYGETAVTCSVCDYSAEYTLSDIATVRAYTADTVYYFKGIVTFIDGKNVYLQDDTAAIVLYMTSSAAAATLAIGDEILVWDTITSYNGLIETTYTTAQEYVKISTGNTATAFEATIADVAADVSTGEYQSEKVQLTEAKITEVGTWSETYLNYSMTISDGTNTLYVYRVPAATAEEVLTAGSVINIKGIVALYSGAYQLRVADIADIEVLSTCAHETTELQGAAANDCTTNGYTGDYVCTVCGVIVTEGEAIPATGHTYVDGYCEDCGAAQPETKTYAEVTVDTVTEGNYIIATTRNATSTYPTVYPANTTITSGHWCVSDSTVTAVDGIITSTDLPLDAIIFTLTGNNTDGFTISYTDADGNVLYLGYSSYAKAKIAFSADYSTIVWNVVADDAGNIALQNTSDSGVYSITASTSAAVTSIRGYASSAIYNSLYLYKEETACTHTNTTTTAAVDATCTTAGMTEIVTCADCGEVITAGEEIAALGHSYVDGVCSACGEKNITDDASLSATMNISVGAEMQVMYTIIKSKVSSYKSFYLEVVKNVAGGDPVTTIFSLDNGNVSEIATSSGTVVGYTATYTGIYASEMGDEFTATLYAVSADGTSLVRGTAVSSSIKSFLYQKLEDTSASAELKTLAVDMLNYGAAAQINFAYDVDNLVNAALTEEQIALGTQGTPEAVSNNKIEGDGGNMQTSVSLQSKVVLYLTAIYTSTEDSNLMFVVKDAEGNVLDSFAPSLVMARGAQGSYSNVGAAQMRDLLTIELYDNDVLVSKTVTWSVEGYVAETRESEDSAEALVNIVNAMLVYGDSAAAYLAASGQ